MAGLGRSARAVGSRRKDGPRRGCGLGRIRGVRPALGSTATSSASTSRRRSTRPRSGWVTRSTRTGGHPCRSPFAPGHLRSRICDRCSPPPAGPRARISTCRRDRKGRRARLRVGLRPGEQQPHRQRRRSPPPAGPQSPAPWTAQVGPFTPPGGGAVAVRETRSCGRAPSRIRRTFAFSRSATSRSRTASFSTTSSPRRATTSHGRTSRRGSSAQVSSTSRSAGETRIRGAVSVAYPHRPSRLGPTAPRHAREASRAPRCSTRRRSPGSYPLGNDAQPVCQCCAR